MSYDIIGVLPINKRLYWNRKGYFVRLDMPPSRITEHLDPSIPVIRGYRCKAKIYIWWYYETLLAHFPYLSRCARGTQ